MAIQKLTSGSTAPKKADVITKLTEMNKVAETHKYEVIAKAGDKQHPTSILWMIKDEKKKDVMKGSIPTIGHSSAEGKNVKPAIDALNKGIELLNGLA